MLGRVADLLCSIPVLGEVKFLTGAGGGHRLGGRARLLLDLAGALELDKAARLVSRMAQALLYRYVLNRVPDLEEVVCNTLGQV